MPNFGYRNLKNKLFGHLKNNAELWIKLKLNIEF